ncbi:unnamed protein product, partial [Adineta steineri]
LVAEATATHVLLAFHMLFINILILNLLIAVFTDTIDKVKENTEFYWRYQRYSFICEYFEQPPCAYPPLIVFSHIMLLARYIYSKLSCTETEDNHHTSKSIILLRNFKMIAAADTTNERWDAFENAATHNCARSNIEKATKSDHLLSDDDHTHSTTSMNESEMMKANLDQQRKINEIDKQMQDLSQKVTQSLEWIMDAMVRVKMNDREKKPPLLTLTSAGDSNVPTSTKPTENSS